MTRSIAMAVMCVATGCASLGGAGTPSTSADMVLNRVNAAVEVAACVDSALAKLREIEASNVSRALAAQADQQRKALPELREYK